jgi:hypothetical protein
LKTVKLAASTLAVAALICLYQVPGWLAHFMLAAEEMQQK